MELSSFNILPITKIRHQMAFNKREFGTSLVKKLRLHPAR
jgi:hypothetical protein